MADSTTTVFLSYAREDVAAATKLYEILSGAGIKVWFDRTTLNPGEKWANSIKRGIKGSRYFVALLSKKSVSKKGYIQKELREALDVLDLYPEDEIYFIPVRLEDCTPSHDRLRELNWVDLFPEWQSGLDKLLNFLRLPLLHHKSEEARYEKQVSPDRHSNHDLRYDGLYQVALGNPDFSYSTYLRFYPDGTVLEVSSPSNPSEIAPWLAKENGYIASGKYMQHGDALFFSTEFQGGIVDYVAKIDQNRMIVMAYSHINQHRGIYDYDFKPITLPNGKSETA